MTKEIGHCLLRELETFGQQKVILEEEEEEQRAKART